MLLLLGALLLLEAAKDAQGAGGGLGTAPAALDLRERVIGLGSLWIQARRSREGDSGFFETSELQLYDFKRQNNILSVSLEDGRNILSNQIQRLAEAYNEAKTKRIQLSARGLEMLPPGIPQALGGGPVEQEAGQLNAIERHSQHRSGSRT